MDNKPTRTKKHQPTASAPSGNELMSYGATPGRITGLHPRSPLNSHWSLVLGAAAQKIAPPTPPSVALRAGDQEPRTGMMASNQQQPTTNEPTTNNQPSTNRDTANRARRALRCPTHKLATSAPPSTKPIANFRQRQRQQNNTTQGRRKAEGRPLFSFSGGLCPEGGEVGGGEARPAPRTSYRVPLLAPSS
jgi:hypothetical protein